LIYATTQIHECTAFYNCHASKVYIPLLHEWGVLDTTYYVIPKQRFGFVSVYKFQFPYPWKPCFVTSWFPRNNFTVATYLPIGFVETAHMSQYKIMVTALL
jgi:hypothetical protein